MEIKDIINYVSNTPYNSNPAVLQSMLSQLNSGGEEEMVKYLYATFDRESGYTLDDATQKLLEDLGKETISVEKLPLFNVSLSSGTEEINTVLINSIIKSNLSFILTGEANYFNSKVVLMITPTSTDKGYPSDFKILVSEEN